MARLAYGDREFSEDTREAEPGDSGTEPGPGDTGEREDEAWLWLLLS